MSSVSPLDLLKQELSSEQLYIRVNAIHRVPIIAVLIGQSKVRSELLPMIESKPPPNPRPRQRRRRRNALRSRQSPQRNLVTPLIIFQPGQLQKFECFDLNFGEFGFF